jgi:hypothetical protein
MRRPTALRISAALAAGIVFASANAPPIVCAARHHAATPVVTGEAGHHDHDMAAGHAHHGVTARATPPGGHACTDMSACCHAVTGVVAPVVGVPATLRTSWATPVAPPHALRGAEPAPATPPPRA